MTRTTALNTGRDDFLSWAETEQGVTLPLRPADAVLTLLALRGADRRSGVPEPTPQLVRQVLHEDLPVLLPASPDELAAVPRVVIALADRVRAVNRLNAKRHARLLDAVQDALPEFERAMNDPYNLTWPRWYASLLRADGVDPGDPGAVRRWLDALAGAPPAERPALPAAVTRADVAGRTFAARALLTEALLGASTSDAGHASAAGPLLPGPPLLTAGPDELERLATELSDRWTADGLGEALAGPHADLAPGPEALPHIALADRFLDEHLDYYGNSALPLPPPPALPAPEDIRGLLHAAPLPAALAAGADGELRELAERCGFPGPATSVWTEGTPQQLTELAADILAATVERIASDTAPAVGVRDEDQGDDRHERRGEDSDEDRHEEGGDSDEDEDEYALDAAHVLYSLYERGGTPDSVARKAADVTGWTLPPELEDAPVLVPDTAPPAYTTPSPQELSSLLGLPGLTGPDREALDSHAQALAAVVDRLAATGCVFRTGDAYGLTPLGEAVVRHVLTVAHVAAPDRAAVLAWSAGEMAEAAEIWPPAVAAAALTSWTAGRGGTDAAWSELLTAVAAAGHPTAGIFSRLALAEIPAAPLRAALTDPVVGAHAQRLLSDRGEDAPPEAVPLSARAFLIVDELHAHWSEDMRAFVTAVADHREDEPAPTALTDAFDRAAATWPGGPAALLEALAATGPGAHGILDDLRARHPDSRVARLAARAARSTGGGHGAGGASRVRA
ncbi:hypothetical protein [Streptomyces sp. NRRL S-118]|uniref:hypothetical protein n=1 Tax=Streptomyces sp. NRRL S-118 TaxID=1463881 RepID=UPI000694B605|nr:hypothetical protein [Streptomyces sp. NRRL S-118]